MESSKIHALLEEICQNVGGRWLLMGGSLIQLKAEAERATEDIDLVGISHESLSDVKAQDELFKAAIRVGLSPENVNSAASFFVHQLQGWQDQIVEIQKGSRGSVYRPKLALFVALKLRRGSEIDLRDVAAAVRAFGTTEFNQLDFKRFADIKALKLFAKHRADWGL